MSALLDRLELTGAEWVLDAGCGEGRVTELLLERAAGVIGVDPDPETVLAARRRLNGRARILQRDLTWMTFDEPFDAVVSATPPPEGSDLDAVFGRLHAALVPGGRLCLGWKGLRGLEAAAREAGFSDVRADADGTLVATA